MMTTVLQDWVSTLSFMQQTVLLTAVRGPDGTPKYGPTKMLLRWYRRCVLLSAMDRQVLKTPWEVGGGSFTGPSYALPIGAEDRGRRIATLTVASHDWCEQMDEIVGCYLREVDAIPHHFQLHFMHAAQILGYKHPDRRIRSWWLQTYERLVHDMHLWPETEEQLGRYEQLLDAVGLDVRAWKRPRTSR